MGKKQGKARGQQKNKNPSKPKNKSALLKATNGRGAFTSKTVPGNFQLSLDRTNNKKANAQRGKLATAATSSQMEIDATTASVPSLPVKSNSKTPSNSSANRGRVSANTKAMLARYAVAGERRAGIPAGQANRTDAAGGFTGLSGPSFAAPPTFLSPSAANGSGVALAAGGTTREQVHAYLAPAASDPAAVVAPHAQSKKLKKRRDVRSAGGDSNPFALLDEDNIAEQEQGEIVLLAPPSIAAPFPLPVVSLAPPSFAAPSVAAFPSLLPSGAIGDEEDDL